MSSEDTKTCPYCAETIKAAATVCRFCGRDLVASAPATRPPAPPRVTPPPAAPAKKRGCVSSALRILAFIVGGIVILGIVINVVRSTGEAAGVFPTRTPTRTPTITPTPTNTPIPTSTPTPVPTLTAEQIKEGAVTIPYRDLARNVETHIGKTVHYTGKIIQAVDDGGVNFNLRVSVDSEGEDVNGNVVWVNYTGKRVLESDKVDFYATVIGLKQYETVFGATVSIPELTTVLLEVLE